MSNNNYQYYSILEINNGQENLIKVNISSLEKKSNNYYRNEFIHVYNKKILEYAIQNDIGIIDESPRNFEIYDQDMEINTLFFGLNKFDLYSDLIISFCGKNDIAVEGDIPPTANELKFRTIEEYNKNDLMMKERGHSYTEMTLANRALYHYLVNGRSKYIKDIKRINIALFDFYKLYIQNEKIKFLNTSFESPCFNSYFKIAQNSEEKFEPDIVTVIYECIRKNDNIKTFFLTGLLSYRDKDIYCNYKIGEYLGQAESSIEKDNIMKLSDELEDTWNQNYLNSIKRLSKKLNINIFLKISYDYPVVVQNIKYRPLE